MTTVTLPTVPPSPESRGGTGPLPPPGRYTVAPGRSFAELTAWCGPLPLRRRRVTVTGATLTVPDAAAEPAFRFVFGGGHLTAVLTSEHTAPVAADRLQITGDLDLDDVRFPVLLRLRVVRDADDRLLVVGAARLPYRLLRRATGYRFGRLRPTTRLRLLVAAEFA